MWASPYLLCQMGNGVRMSLSGPWRYNQTCRPDSQFLPRKAWCVWVCLSVCAHVYMCRGSHVEVREQLCAVCSLRSPFHGFWDLNFGARLASCLPAELSCLPTCRDSMEGHYGYIVDLDTCFPQGDGDKNCFGGGGRFSVCSSGV